MNYIATFHTHLSALRSCAALKSRGISGRLAPVPRRISSSCGTCVFYEGEDMALEAMDRDLEAINLIECFKESGLTIREIRHFMSLVREGDITLEERLAIYQTHIARLEEKLTAVQNALEHSRRTLAFYEIAAKTGSEETAKDLYLARYGEENG